MDYREKEADQGKDYTEKSKESISYIENEEEQGKNCREKKEE